MAVNPGRAVEPPPLCAHHWHELKVGRRIVERSCCMCGIGRPPKRRKRIEPKQAELAL